MSDSSLSDAVTIVARSTRPVHPAVRALPLTGSTQSAAGRAVAFGASGAPQMNCSYPPGGGDFQSGPTAGTGIEVIWTGVEGVVAGGAAVPLAPEFAVSGSDGPGSCASPASATNTRAAITTTTGGVRFPSAAAPRRIRVVGAGLSAAGGAPKWRSQMDRAAPGPTA